MTKIRIIIGNEYPTWVNTVIYIDGMYINNVRSFEHTIKAEEPEKLEIEFIDSSTNYKYKKTYIKGIDDFKMIWFQNWKQFFEELR